MALEIVAEKRNFLFLQGPITPFFKLLADELERQGHNCFRINLCFGDWLFWRGRPSVQFRGSQKDWPAFIEKFLVTHQITDLVLLGEQRYYHQIAIQSANKLNIQVVTTDFGYLRPDWITFEKNGMSSNSEFPKCPEKIMALGEKAPPLDHALKYKDSFFQQVFWDVSYHLLSTLFRPLYPRYTSHQLYHPVLVYLGTGFRLLKLKFSGNKKADNFIDELCNGSDRFMLFPLQMQNDFQIRAYSRYDNIQQALDEVIESFAENAPEQMKLVIKVHPLDPGMVSWQSHIKECCRKHGLADRVEYLDGGSLAQLIQACEGVVTINSTVGIWALRQHKPVCVLGEAIFDVQGLTTKALDQFWNNPIKPSDSLLDAYLRALGAYLHIRGVYYSKPGLLEAVSQASERLLDNKVNQLI